MIDLGEKNCCKCQRFNNSSKMCINQYTITENGKTVKLVPGSNEESQAVILDKCLICDNDPKCDAMFLYKSRRGKYSFLVELKGSTDIERAFFQLSYTRDKRLEYKEIIKKFSDADGIRVFEKFAIVSNGMLSKPQLERLENEYRIRVKKILHCEASTPVPDLKELI